LNFSLNKPPVYHSLMLQSFIFAEKIPGTELIWYNKNSFCRYLYNRENV